MSQLRFGAALVSRQEIWQLVTKFIFSYLACILCENCDFYNNSSDSQFAGVRWRKASRKGRSVGCPDRRSDNTSRNMIFWYLIHILFGDCDFYNNSSVSEFARIRWRKASRKGRSVVVWTGDLTARHEIHVLDIWHAYYSGIATFIKTRPLVNLEESGDARLQKGTVRPIPYLSWSLT